jgi:hypothetical protein
MIKVIANNFDNWIDVFFNGQLVDNFKTRAMAIQVANQLQTIEKAKGRHIPIRVRLKD